MQRTPSGEVARATGIAGTAAYGIDPPSNAQYNNSSFFIAVVYADRSSMGEYATFETNPRRLQLSTFDGYFMPLAKAAP